MMLQNNSLVSFTWTQSMAKKLRGTKVWLPTQGRLQVFGAGEGRPLPLWGSGVSPPENFWKLRC